MGALRLNRFLALVYHSVADNDEGPWHILSYPIAQFERHARYLARNGFTTVPLTTLAALQASGETPPPKTLALTFDDGFLDNWVFTYPILKRYGLRATVFVTPEFVHPGDEIRPTLEDASAAELQQDRAAWWGYASWPELRRMQEGGVFDVQSHGLTHTCYFSDATLVDFHHPGDAYPWLDWNMHPEQKPFWPPHAPQGDLAYGYPIYTHDSALAVRQYHNDRGLAAELTDYVRERGGARFCASPGWKEELRRVVRAYTDAHPLQDGYETEAECRTRLLWEMTESRRQIEQHMGTPVTLLCWPNSRYTEEAHRLAVEEAGYTATVAGGEWPEPAGRKDLMGRVSFGQGEYVGPCKRAVHYAKFLSAVESRSGTGARHRLIRLYQKMKSV